MSSSHSHISGVLLAGGKSRRMGGGDKCLLELAGSPMLAWVIERMQTQVDSLAINANGSPARFSLFNRPVIPDPYPGQLGPLAGILAGMRWASEKSPDYTHIATCPTDAPFIPLDLVKKLNLKCRSDGSNIVLASSNGRTHPVFGLWPVKLKDDLDEAVRSGTRKIMDWAEKHPTQIVEFKSVKIGTHDMDPFFNTNTPENMGEARLALETMLN